MVAKTYSPFIELTRTEEVAGLSTLVLVNVDTIATVRCLDDGGATVFFTNGDFITPVENYAFFVNMLTELTATSQPVD